MDNEIGVTREEEGGIRDYLSLGIMLWGLGLALRERLEINKYLPRGVSRE